jgi:DMSO/TMAO reductase YedYZ heme-binding membrane subunit
MIALTTKLSWYIARSSGMVAWALVTASILWGLALSSRLVRRRGVPAWLLALHRYLGTLSIVFVVVHLLALVADNYVYFGWKELFVPMATKWRPGPTAWGIAGFYLLVAIQITSWLMRRLPRKVWHTIHLSSFVLFVAGTVHGFQSGADRDNRLVQWAALVGSVLVVTLLVFRLLHRSPFRKRARASRRDLPVLTPR